MVEVEVQSYSNPGSRCTGPGCGCDSPQGCRCCDDNDDHVPSSSCENGLRCDNKFTYCLQHEASMPGSGCSQTLSRASTSKVNWNDNSIDFSQDVVLGLNNSFTLIGLDNAWMVRENV